MASVSSDVLWEILKRSNSFLIRRDNRDFSTDPFNLAGAHTRSFAGIASNSSIGVATRAKPADPVTLRLKKQRKYGVAGKTGHVDTISVKGPYHGRAANALVSLTENRNKNLAAVALKRMKRLNNIDFPKKTITKRR